MMTMALNHPLIDRIGWTLVHSVWQCAAIAAALAITRLVAHSAAYRYIASCAALLLCLMASIVTFAFLTASHSPVSTSLVVVESFPLVPPALAVVAHEPHPRPQTLVDVLIPFFALAWCVGVAGLSVWNARALARVHRLRVTATTPLDECWRRSLERLRKCLHVQRDVMLGVSALIDVPSVIGWLKPIILVPGAALSGLSPQQLEALIAHELAHIRRHDYLVNLIQTIIETLVFYHPAVWWISRQIRQEREYCCDDLAATTCGDQVIYAEALARMEEVRAVHAGLALSAGGGSLLRRIRRLFEPPVAFDRRSQSLIASIPGLAFVLLLVLSIGFINASHVEANGNEPAATQPTQPMQSRVGVYYVSGLKKSGTYALTERPITLKQALIAAGGGDIRNQHVTVVRTDDQTGRLRTTIFAINDLLESDAADQPIEPGDVLMVTQVPPATQPSTAPAVLREYYVGGDVSRTGVYSLGPRPINVLQALIAAGANPPAIADRIVIIHRRRGPSTVQFKIGDLITSSDGGGIIEAGDQITVREADAK